MDVEEKDVQSTGENGDSWWEIPVPRRLLFKMAGATGAVAATTKVDKRAAVRLALAPAREALAEFGRDLLELIREADPDIFQAIVEEYTVPEAFQPSDEPRFPLVPPEESSFYLEDPKAEEVITGGIVDLFYDGQYSFTGWGAEEVLTTEETARKSRGDGQENAGTFAGAKDTSSGED